MAVDQGPVSGDDKSTREDEGSDGLLTQPAKKRSREPRVRVVGGRIYDSVNGKSCHQCRQKTMDIVAACKGTRKNKPCPIMYCHKCLLNRYGEKTEEVDAEEGWICPRCRDICNCSFCMKKRGHKPTGILANVAKATGFSSVSELLLVGSSKSGENHEEVAEMLISLNKSPRKPGKENLVAHNAYANQEQCGNEKARVEKKDKKRKKQEQLQHDCKMKLEGIKERSDGAINVEDGGGKLRQPKKLRLSKDARTSPRKLNVSDDAMTHQPDIDVENEVKKEPMHDEIPLPLGSELKTVEGIEMNVENVGNALQFLEFCSVFKEVLELRNGQAKNVLQDIFCGRNSRRAKFSVTVQFHIHMMSILQHERGEEEFSPISPITWFDELKNCLSESQSSLKAIGLENTLENQSDYETFGASQKLKLLNLLCDEVLGTEKVRKWMDEQHSKNAARIKEAKQEIQAAKKEEKSLKQQMKDDIARAIIEKQGAPLTVSEHEAVIERIKSKVEEARANVLQSKGLLYKNNKTSNVVRVDPVYAGRGGGGNAYWNLSFCGESDKILRQSVRQGDDFVRDLTLSETWFALEEDNKPAIEKLRHCSLSVGGGKRRHDF